MELMGEGSVINGATPSSLNHNHKQSQVCVEEVEEVILGLAGEQ